MGELYSTNLGKNKLAISYFERIINIYKDPVWLVKASERVAEINFNFLKNFEDSRKNYQMLANFTPRLEKIDYYQHRLARSLFNLGLLNLAAKEFQRIQGNPEHEYYTRSFYELGMVHFRKKDWNKAIAFWKEYLKRETRKDAVVQTKFMMANAFETSEQLKRAYNLYYSILGEYPNTEVLRNRLNSIYHRRIARKR